MTKPVRTCDTSDCGKPRKSKGMCGACYQWSRRHGKKPETVKQRQRPKQPKRPCETPDCDRTTSAPHGLCSPCYKRWKRHGEKPKAAAKPTRKVQGKVCEITGCGQPRKASGMCGACYAWWLRTGKKPETPRPTRPPKKEFCEIPGCDKPHKSKGMCNPCYQWSRAHGKRPESAEQRSQRPKKPPRLCETPDCGKRHDARGLCAVCYQWWKKHGERPTTADRRRVRGGCETPDCGKEHFGHGLCSSCHAFWRRTGERPKTPRQRPLWYNSGLNVDEETPVVHSMVRADLDLSADDKELIWNLGRHQSQIYNIGIEVALQAIDTEVYIPSNWTTDTEVLTPSRHIETIPQHPVQLQRVGLHHGLKTVRMYRSQYGKYRASLEYLSEDIMKARKKGDTKKLEILERRQARTERKLEKLLAKGTKRFFRKRKDAERGRMPALVFDGGAKVSETHLGLPGRHWLKFREPFMIPEGYALTGAVQVVDVTRKFTCRTKLRHRHFRAHIGLKKVAPELPPPETEDDLLGIDLGIVIPVCTSTGKKIYLKDAEQEAKSWAHIKYLNRCMSKHDPGSRRHKKQMQRYRKAHRKRANRRRNASRHAAKEVTDHAQKQDCVMIVAEDLKHQNMRRSAAGTLEHPGRRVAATRALNRKLWRAAMGRLQTDIERRCLRTGIDYIKVPPHGTSQQCNVCGTKGGRETQAVFLCSHCGWFGNADHNAARNIRAKGWAAVGSIVDRRPGVTNKQLELPGVSKFPIRELLECELPEHSLANLPEHSSDNSKAPKTDILETGKQLVFGL